MTEKPAWDKGFLWETDDETRQEATASYTPGPSLVTTDSPIIKAILRASEVMLGNPAEPSSSPSAFDQGPLNPVGIVTANFGAGEHQYAHPDYDMACRAHRRCGQGLRLHDAGLSGLALVSRARCVG